jgi:SAM-dependent methyltransferase
MKNLLEAPFLYHLYQLIGGFEGGRKKMLQEVFSQYPKLVNVYDIGCGPGHISRFFPKNISYIGFDTNEVYINYAKQNFHQFGQFLCEPFSGSVARIYGQSDLIVMNGLLHHLDDESALDVLRQAKECLSKDGVVFTLDGCYTEKQNYISKFLLDHDRGEFVRNFEEYNNIFCSVFNKADIKLRSDLSLFPYTFITMLGVKN